MINIKVTITDDDGTEYTLADIAKLAKAVEKLNKDEAKVEKQEQVDLFPCYAIDPLPCKGGTWQPSQLDFEKWKDEFPSVMVKAELDKARSWLLDDPKNLKTHNGMKTFCRKWLRRVQRAATPTIPTISQPKKPKKITVDNMRFDLRKIHGAEVNDLSDDDVRDQWENRCPHGMNAAESDACSEKNE